MNLKGIILDMDGVLWRGEHLLVDIPATFRALSSLGLRILLMTNNATRAPKDFIIKFKRLGVDLEPWQVVNSAQVTGEYLQNRFPGGGPVFMVGEAGLQKTLEEHGFYHDATQALAVVGSLDRGLTYEKLSQATLLIRAGVPFIGTNPDASFPIPQGEVPGAGAILALLEAASGVKPLVIGKPAAPIYQTALDRLGMPASETLAVGDRISTDIAGGQAAGCQTGLVLSGISTREEANRWSPPIDLIAKDLNDLVRQIAASRSDA